MHRATLTKAIVLPVFLQPWSAMAQPYPRGGDWPGPWHMWGGGPGFWWIVPLLVIVALGFVFLRGSGRERNADPSAGALALLSERFARGEISKEEFEEKRAILGRLR